jgi:phage-related protein
MAFDTWAPLAVPQLGSNFTDNQTVLEAQFGDGYSQIVGDGINSVWAGGDLTWNGLTVAQLDDLRTFWRAHGTAEPFLWTVPDEASARLWRFTAPLKRQSYGGDIFSASTTIKEAFDIA